MARKFNGTSDFIDVAAFYSPIPGATTAISVAAWVKTSAVAAGCIIGGDPGSPGGSRALQFTVSATGKVTAILFTNSGANSNTWTSTASVNDGKWHHVAFTFLGGSGKGYIYIDGALDTSSTPSNAVTNTLAQRVFRIGRQLAGVSQAQFFNGWIDSVVMQTRFISADEVWMLASNGPAGVNVTRQMEHYWPLQSQSDGIEEDYGRVNRGLGIGKLTGTTPSGDNPPRLPFQNATWRGPGQLLVRVGIAPGEIDAPFLSATATLFDPGLIGNVAVPFLSLTANLYTPTLTGSGNLSVPFLSAHANLHSPFSLYTDRTTLAPGNGGEIFDLQLAPNGTSVVTTLTSGISATEAAIHLPGAGFPSTGGFCITVGSEVMYVKYVSGDTYRIVYRGLSNTDAAAHVSGVSATWGDTYDMAIVASNIIGKSFTADITSSGSTLYPGFLIAFDSTQAYVSGSRYPMYVTSMLGVFDAGAGSGGTNRTDGAQPNKIRTTATISNDCPAALSNPARMVGDVLIGDVALVRYTNPEASTMTLVSRAAAIQSWFGIKRVDSTDHDVTTTDPNGISIDGTVNGVWLNPLGPGIAPDTGLPSNHDVPYTSVTMLGSVRTFTHGGLPSPPNYNEKGWPICCLAVRNNTRRIPFWDSWDWRDFNYVFTGYADDATYAANLVNRNGIVFQSVPEVELPGPQDIDGPDAVWDDKTYYFAASWYIALFSTPYLVVGPGLGGSGFSGDTSGGGFTPGVSFGGGAGSPVVTVPGVTIEGGSGGGFTPPGASRFDAKMD